MKSFLDWLQTRENTARTAMSGKYPLQYYAGEYPPLAVTPKSSSAARAYTHQYKSQLGRLRGAKKHHKKKKED
jgi:hypothetical protein